MGRERRRIKKERSFHHHLGRRRPCCAAHNRQNGQEIKNSHALFFYNRPHTETQKKKENKRWRVCLSSRKYRVKDKREKNDQPEQTGGHWHMYKDCWLGHWLVRVHSIHFTQTFPGGRKEGKRFFFRPFFCWLLLLLLWLNHSINTMTHDASQVKSGDGQTDEPELAGFLSPKTSRIVKRAPQ